MLVRGVRVRVRHVGVPLALGALVATAGCNTSLPVVSGEAGDTAQSPSPTVPDAALQFSLKDAQTPVKPDEALKVAVQGGELVSVRLIGPDKKPLGGKIVDGVWQVAPDTRLVPDASYTWRASAKNSAGKVTQEERSFTTIKPKVTATYRVTPDGATVGVGMPVMVTFDSAVKTPQMRADVEKRLSIKVTPAQKGSWGWLDERQLMWRPDSYWKPGTKINVNAPLTGVQTGDGKWIAENKGATFDIAKRSRVSTVDLANHVMTVRENGKKVASYPISAGKATDEWETRSGTKIITEKHADYVMDAGTLGVGEDDPNYYRTEVKYAMRVTNTGEFLHAAPWSVWAQGRRNVSHGCVNMSTAAAGEMFRASIIGDVIEFTGSARKMKPGDGMSVWLFDAKEWRERSAVASS